MDLKWDENTKFDNTLTNVSELIECIKTDERINHSTNITPIDYTQVLKEGSRYVVKDIRQRLRKELEKGEYAGIYIDEIFELSPLWLISSDKNPVN